MIGAPGFDPSTNTLPITGSTLALTSTGTKLTLNYDGSHRGTIDISSSGAYVTNLLDAFDIQWQFQGTTIVRFLSSYLRIQNASGGFVTDTGALEAGRTRFGVSSGSGFVDGPGLSDGGAANTLGLCIGGVDKAVLTTSLLKITSGVDLQLGVAAVAETPTATHTLTIKASNGVSYKVLAVAA